MIMFPWIITLALLNQISLSLKLLILYGIIALIRNILEPHLLSKKIKIPALYMFVAMYLFMKLMVAPFVLLVLNNFRQKNNFQEIYKIIKKSLWNLYMFCYNIRATMSRICEYSTYSLDIAKKLTYGG